MLSWQELWAYARALLRWWPLLFLATALAAGSAAVLARGQPDYYRARASLMVGNNFEVAAPDRFAVEVSNSLARFYEVLLRREVIQRAAAEQLQLPFAWQLIDRLLWTEINPQANLIEIVITDSDPQRAAALANALGDQLIAYGPNAPEKVAAQRAEVERQLREAQASVAETDARLVELRDRQRQLNAAVDLRENQEQIDELGKARERYEAAYNSLLRLQSNADVNTLAFFERAVPPAAPLPQKTVLIVAGAGFGGLLVACVAAILLDILDTRWRPGAVTRQRMGIRNLGGVHYGPQHAPRSAGHQRAVRETHTQLVLAAHGSPPRMLLVSSPEPSESRSEYAIDLAGVFGEAGHKVLLVDAELARSHVSRLITEREGGISAARATGGAIERWSSRGGPSIPAELWVRLRATHLSNVVLLPGRPHDDGHSMLVPLLHWPELVRHLQTVADVVIFDGPSALSGADAALLAPLVDGVVLVLNPAADSRMQIEETKARLLHSPDARLLGAVTVTAPRPQRSARRRHGRLAFAIDREGITISLPGRSTAPQLTDAKYGVAPSVEDVRRAAPLPEATSFEELVARSVGTEEVVTVAPPSPPIITPPPGILITPIAQDRSQRSTGRKPTRPTIARGRTGRRNARPLADGDEPATDTEL